MNLLRDGGRLLRIGHRGAAALEPANTLPSLKAALAAGVDMVEIDVLAIEDKLVLTHSARELAPGAPTLDEALDVLRGHPVLVDVKGRGFERELVDALRRHHAVAHALASTTDLQVLRELRQLEPSLTRSLTYPRHRARAAVLQPLAPLRVPRLVARAGAAAATLHHRVISRTLVNRCHARGVAVLAWTVNDVALVATLDRLGVDGVITDNPGVFSPSGATLQG